MIKAFFFDLGDIFFEAHYWRKWNYNYLVKNKLFEGSFADFYNYYDFFLKSTYTGKVDYSTTFDRFIFEMGVPNPEIFKEESINKKVEFEQNRTLFPEVVNTLKSLNNRGIKCIILSDNEFSGDELRERILNIFNINHLIDEVYTSYDLGVCKPEIDFFNQVLFKTSLKKNEVIFVAHDVDEINGAVEMGIRVVEFNNYLKLKNNADYRISKFDQLINLI